MPRAIVGHQFGPPEAYVLEEFDPGAPGPGQIRVAIKAAGISFVDVLIARGEYQFKPPLPFIPGSEVAGTVSALGEGVTVFGESAGAGSIAALMVMPDAAGLFGRLMDHAQLRRIILRRVGAGRPPAVGVARSPPAR